MLQSYTEHVKRYGIAELVFQGPSEGNPFAEQWVKGTMAGQAEEKHAEGFYDGNGVYKLRFMPSGEGTYEITAATSWGDEAKVTVEVGAADEGCHGPVRVANTYHLLTMTERNTTRAVRPVMCGSCRVRRHRRKRMRVLRPLRLTRSVSVFSETLCLQFKRAGTVSV